MVRMEGNSRLNIIKERGAQFSGEVKERTVGYVTAAFGLVAGLAWNDAIKALIDMLFPASAGSSIVAKFTYAAILTVFVVLITAHLFTSRREGGE